MFPVGNIKFNNMKFSLSTAIFALTASAVNAQTNQTGPFLLHITGKTNSSINGKMNIRTAYTRYCQEN
jgi:hypothetical protein